MVFKLSKNEENDLENKKGAAGVAFKNLSDAIEIYNTKHNETKEDVEKTLEAYNTALTELKSFVDGIAEDKRSEHDDKSDSWKEGDAGGTADEWISTWENADLEEVTLTIPEEITIEFDNAGEIDLPVEP